MSQILPEHGNLPINVLARVFKSTTNSYKYYWFWAIVDQVKFGKSPKIPINLLLAKMAGLSWFTINFFKISFGKQDRLRDAVKEILQSSELKEDDTFEKVCHLISSEVDRRNKLRNLIQSFGRFVPQRFLSPFFANELRGMKDYQKDKLIKELAKQRFSNSSPPIYRFSGNEIEIHPTWFHYLKQNSAIIEGYILWNLTGYLQSRNPNIPNISKKLILPEDARDLKDARRFWNLVLQRVPISCLYSKTEINIGKYSIDHFVPWSFVAHDMLWNLAPIEKSVNSSKSNNLPNLDRYFPDFSKLQYRAYQIVYKEGKSSLLEDYAMLFSESDRVIASYSESDFSEGLYKRITPLIQIATNSGFTPNWTYS